MLSSFWSIFDASCGDHDRDIKTRAGDIRSLPECDYDTDCSALYRQIQLKNWQSVNQFLLTGYWTGGLFPDRSPPTDQACTWVTKYDKKEKRKKVVWTHLPIHAALIYGAPDNIIKVLIKICPATLRCADDRRMLPLHLAFMHGSSDQALGMVLDEFPDGFTVRNIQGRTPAECAVDGPNYRRSQIISTVLVHNKKTWEKMAARTLSKQHAVAQKALNNRNEKISQLETAMNLIRCREDQTQDSFSLVVSEIQKLQKWYKQKEADASAEDGKPLDATFVTNVALKLDYLQAYAEELVEQQTQAKEDSEKTLSELYLVGGSKKVASPAYTQETNVKVHTPQTAIANQQDQTSDVSSHTSLETRSTKRDSAAPEPVALTHTPQVSTKPAPDALKKTVKKQELAPMKMENGEDDGILTIPSEFKDDETAEKKFAVVEPEKALVEEKKHEPTKSYADAPIVDVQVPSNDKPTLDDDSIERELRSAISDMTSLDMADDMSASSRSSKITKMLSFGKKLKISTKKASSANKALPTKGPGAAGSVRSHNKGRVIARPRKISPTM